MSRKMYDEASVIRSLSNKASININPINRTIEVLKENVDVGNGSWGKIDYLHKVHGYIQVFVNTISKKFVKTETNTKSNSISKIDKREQKLNMAKLAKNAMKKAKQ